MKVALAELGRIDEAHVRPPVQPLDEAERTRIRNVVARAALDRG